MRQAKLWRILVPAVAALLAACGGGGDGGGAPTEGASGLGTLQVSLTDAPACGYDAVYVNVREVRVHTSAAAGDGDGGWQSLAVEPARRIDLLHLTNGDLAALGSLTLPAGTYTQLRLVLADDGNAVVPTGGSETALKTPSGQQSGLKIPMNLVVPEGQAAHVVIDFDACKSIVKAGKSGKYLLKPVLRAIAVLTDTGQKVQGCVAQTLPLPSTIVSLQQDGVPVKSTVPRSEDGCFVLSPVPVGSYDLVVAAPGHVTAVMTDVPVNLSAATIVSTAALRIAPPLSPASYAVEGTVTPFDAGVRALQALTDGPTVEVAWIPVDSSDGSFGASLPAGAPIVTSYLTINPLIVPGTLGFEPDEPVAGQYTIEAARTGLSTETVDIDLSAGPVSGLAFTLN